MPNRTPRNPFFPFHQTIKVPGVYISSNNHLPNSSLPLIPLHVMNFPGSRSLHGPRFPRGMRNVHGPLELGAFML